MKKNILYIVYMLVVCFILLEIAIRILTTTNAAHVELFMNKKHRYLLPLPTEPQFFYEGTSDNSARADLYRTYDDTLGWSHAAWGWDTTDFACFANDKGLRISETEFQQRKKSQKHYDILTIGNSFTHGDAVPAEDSWPYLLAKNTGKSVGNLGVGGYGLQQAFLRLLYSGITADTVVFGVIWGDFERALEPVYTFYQGGNKTRPMLSFKNTESYNLLNVPVLKPEAFYALKKEHKNEIFAYVEGFDDHVFSDTLWTKSYVSRLLISLKHQKKTLHPRPIYLTDGGNLDYCIQIFKLFKAYCNKHNMYPIVVLLDTEQNFWHADKWNLSNPWTLVSNKLAKENITHVDFHDELLEAFNEHRTHVIHKIENVHYSPEGNALVARLIASELKI